jgi:hypothetical protein
MNTSAPEGTSLAKLTIVFGILLILISAGAFFIFAHHPHTLIPGAFGIVLAILGVLADSPDPRRRMLFMHFAVTIGLLGFLGTIPGLIGAIHLATGGSVERPDAAYLQTIMGILCLIYVLLCVRSFIAARRLRNSNS